MSNIIESNPLMLPVQYNGQTYLTSQFLHANYKNNDGGKYAQLPHFNRLIRSIETYSTYLERGDIVELIWKDVKNQTDPNFGSVIPLLKSNNCNPVMLINMTAQFELIHHLDDEISKRMAVAVNDKVTHLHNSKAIEEKPIDALRLSRTHRAMLALAKMNGLEGNQAILSANKATRKLEGIGPLELLELELVAEVKEKDLNPTQIGKELGGLSAIKINQLLEKHGYQIKLIDGTWQPTEKGKPFGEMKDTEKRHSDGSMIKQWRWYFGIIEELKLLETA